MNNPFQRSKEERKTEVVVIGARNEDAYSDVRSLTLRLLGCTPEDIDNALAPDSILRSFNLQCMSPYLEGPEYPVVLKSSTAISVPLLELCSVLNILRESRFGYMADFQVYTGGRASIHNYVEAWFSSLNDTPKVSGKNKALCELAAKLMHGEVVDRPPYGLNDYGPWVLQSHWSLLHERATSNLRDLDHLLGGT